MFREPLAHGLSRPCTAGTAMQDGDPFVRTYMVGSHHEFGGSKPFRFGSEPATGDPDTLDSGWTGGQTIIDTLTVDGRRLLLVSHAVERVPDGRASNGPDRGGGRGGAPQIEPHTRQRDVNDTVDPKRLEAARAVYDQLVERALHLD